MTFDNSTAHPAAVYDQGVRHTIPFYEALQQQTLDLVRAVKPEPACWLDTGCGTGYLVELALPLFPQTHFVLADPSASMLEQARQRFAGRPEPRVDYLPPQPSEKLSAWPGERKPQVITAVMCHHYLRLPERQRAVQACYALLETGGLFVAFETIEPATGEGTAIGLKRWRSFQLEAGRSPSVVEAHLQRFNTELFPLTVAAHLALLKSVGFRTVEHFWLSQLQAGFYALK
jgi:tRNA (cmo5U34)-methyltransferase